MKRPPVWLLVVVTATGALALNIFVPSIPGLTRYFDTDLATVQLALSLYLVGVALGQLVHGPLSDQFGRRPVLLTGLGIFVAGGLACALAPTIEMLILGRVFQAIGACAGFVIGRAMVRDVYGRDQAAAALGYITAAVSVFPAISPAIGGHIEIWFGWRASFVFVLAVGCSVLLLSLARAHETNFQRQPAGWSSLLRGYMRLLVSRTYLGYALNVALTSTAFFTFLGGAPVIMSDVLHQSPDRYGWYFIGVSGAYMVGSAVTGRFTSVLGLERMAISGTLLSFLGGASLLTLALGGFLTPLALFLPMWVIALGNGLSQPNCTAAAISTSPQNAGAASGLLGCMQMGFGAVGTVLVGRLHDNTLLPMAAVMIVSLVGAVLVLLMARLSGRAR